jgi:hypothetical protein
VFLTESILSLLVAVLVWFTLTDQPRDACWLTGPEREMLQARSPLAYWISPVIPG